MQTFLPSADFEQVAQSLDNQRLNKQALEGWQIMMTNLQLDPAGNQRTPKGWYNHPAVKMWRGYESALLEYIGAMVFEWKRRGYKSTIFDKATATYERALTLNLVRDERHTTMPIWMSDKSLYDGLMASHRIALLNKNYEWYSQFNWVEDTGTKPASYEYVWAN